MSSCITVQCGYHTAGKADLLPRTIRTIYVPALANGTSDPKISSLLAEAISREFITRTRYQPVPNADAADAVLSGAVLKIERIPTVYDPVITDPKTGQSVGTGRASVVKVAVSVQVTLTERATGKVLFRQDHMDLSEAYQLAPSSSDYFDESGVALERVARDAARSMVSRILEQF